MGKGVVPRTHSLTFTGLFRYGPWEVILPLWALGAFGVWVALGDPVLRILLVTDAFSASFVVGSIFGVVVSIMTYRIFGRLLAIRPILLIAVSAIAGALLGAAASGTVFGLIRDAASPCSPLVAVAESSIGRVASFVLPIILYLGWCKFLILGFPSLESFDHLVPHSPASRYRAYERALWSLPIRLLVTTIIFFFLWKRAAQLLPPHAIVESPQRVVSTLAIFPSYALEESLKDPSLEKIVEEARRAGEARAISALHALKFDEARPWVAEAACHLRLPGYAPDSYILEAENSFKLLDEELDNAGSGWVPSEAGVQAILSLLPIRVSKTSPVCPLFLRSEETKKLPPGEVSNSDLRRPDKKVQGLYREEKLMDVIPAGFRGSDNTFVPIEVAMKVVGQVGGSGTSFVALLKRRLGTTLSDGPKTIGNGAICALWQVGRIGIRVGPAVSTSISDDEMSPISPLWVTCYDMDLGGILNEIYQRPDAGPSWDPHGCNLLPSSPASLEPGGEPSQGF